MLITIGGLKMDLRKSYQEVITLRPKTDKSTGCLYRKDNIIQAWWKTDVLGRVLKTGRETWIFPNEEDAKETFFELGQKFNE